MASRSKYGGLAITTDTGAPEGVDNYITLILLHGFSFHSGKSVCSSTTDMHVNVEEGIFERLVPLAAQYKCRLVLVNRRGYINADPYTDEDLNLLREAQNGTPQGKESMTKFMPDRGRDVYEFLVDFIRNEESPLENRIVLAGWSYSSCWMLSLLAYASTFPENDIEVPRYLRRVVTFGTFSIRIFISTYPRDTTAPIGPNMLDNGAPVSLPSLLKLINI
jgi:pimeloyl-ACP methyl ester carboxylesterase